jgi:hypothetical protein
MSPTASRTRVNEARPLNKAATARLRMLKPVPGARSADAVDWRASTVAGRGLFAERRFEPGELVSRSPALAVRYADLDPKLAPYGFRISRGPAEGACPDEEMPYAIVFGPVSVCNHAEAPNAAVSFRHVPECGLEAALVAMQPIAAGEEILIRYPDFGVYRRRGLI